MSNLAKRFEQMRSQNVALRAQKSTLENQALQHMVAMGGGVLGALATRYLPGAIPGQQGDQAALLASTLVLDGVALYTGSPELLSLSYAYEGKIVGDAFEVAMGWRPSPAKV